MNQNRTEIEHHQCVDIIHFTDTHLFADHSQGLYGLNSDRALRAVITQAKTRPMDLALATGDLVHDETAEGYEAFKAICTPLDGPVYCLAGNHDDVGEMKQVFANSPVKLDGRVALGHWQIIMLNSAVPGNVAGRLSEQELRRLDNVLTAKSDTHALVCLHHQPVDIGCEWLDRIGLENSEAFFEVLDKHPQVKVVIWGHVHQTYEGERNGVRLLATPSTGIQFKPQADQFELDLIPPGFRWLCLHADGMVETAVERLEAIPGEVNPDAKGY